MKQTRSELAIEELESLRAYDREYHHSIRKQTEKYLEYKKNYYQDNKEQLGLSVKKTTIKRKYGITWDEFIQMYETQEGLCAICKSEEEGRMLSIDHCHETRKVRGLLCGTCNRALGLFKDDPEILQAAKEYVS